MQVTVMADLEDVERCGQPPVYDHDDVLLQVKLVTKPPPEEATRWMMEALAQAMHLYLAEKASTTKPLHTIKER